VAASPAVLTGSFAGERIWLSRQKEFMFLILYYNYYAVFILFIYFIQLIAIPYSQDPVLLVPRPLYGFNVP
jgi:hypothetical protein